MGTKKDNDDNATTTSHSEAQILRECINLMQNLVGDFRRYLYYVDFKPSCEEQEFHVSRNYLEIVQKLFLRGTTHSGGTSTCKKCRELGVDPFEQIDFGFDYDPDYDPWYDTFY